jgi:arylsulfatase A-like enzyme
VVTTDLYPTICALAGVPFEAAGREGMSFAPVLRDPGRALAREALCFHYPHYYPTTTPVSAIRAGPWKLLEFHEDRHVELYHLGRDLGETTDLAAAESAQAETLRRELHDYLTSVGAQMPREAKP